MTLDTSDLIGGPSNLPAEAGGGNRLPGESSQWDALKKRVRDKSGRQAVRDVFGDPARGGAIYRWGKAASDVDTCHDSTAWLSRLACGSTPRKKLTPVDLEASCEEAIDALGNARTLSALDAARAVTWAAALPALTRHLDQKPWWDLLGCLQQMRESVLQRSEVESCLHLMLGAELGLTLAWRLSDLPSCKRLEKSSLDAFAKWCKYEDEAVQAAIAGATDARLVLASFIRCQRMIEKTTKRKVKKQQLAVGEELATWVAALTTYTGSTAFSAATRKQCADDLPPNGLLASAMEFDRDALEPAIAAALGKSQSGGRLAWEVSLPEAFHHGEEAKVAIMFPEWDVRRGRVHLDYSDTETRIEMFGGRVPLIDGTSQVMIERGGESLEACGPWDSTCEYTDDDVHYLEIEQPWTSGWLLQRQIMIIRDDRCVLFADSVIPKQRGDFDPNVELRYDCRLPLSEGISVDPEPETRELFLSDGKRRGLVFPLAASEWRVGPTDVTLKASNDDHLVVSSHGRGRIYSPLWFDFQQRRFRRKRTWRQLTVAEDLRIVENGEATGFRVQVGSEQWLVYRSLMDQRCRTVLGKHLIADFFAARFDTGDGSLEELVTVDDHDSSDDG